MDSSDKTKKRCKYTFTLRNINLDNLRKTYNADIPIQLSGKPTVVKKQRKRKQTNVTQISELNGDTSNRVSFLDETKQSRSGIISNIQYNIKFFSPLRSRKFLITNHIIRSIFSAFVKGILLGRIIEVYDYFISILSLYDIERFCSQSDTKKADGRVWGFG